MFVVAQFGGWIVHHNCFFFSPYVNTKLPEVHVQCVRCEIARQCVYILLEVPFDLIFGVCVGAGYVQQSCSTL